MTSRSQRPADINLRSTIRSWLASWEFIDNPFATWEAGQEPQLERYFIKRPFFDQLLHSQKSALVFAPRGGGKSATRIMLEAECRPATPTAAVIAVSFTDFSPFAESHAPVFSPTLSDYLPHLITTVLARVFSALMVNPTAAAQLSSEDFGELRYWLDRYASYILAPDYLGKLLRHTESRLPDELLMILIGYIQRDQMLPGNVNPDLLVIARLLRALQTGLPIPPSGPTDSPSRIIEAIVRLSLRLLSRGPNPCRALYILIDGIDEYALTQDNPEASVALLRALLGNLHFLELPGLAVKFFLPTEQQHALERVTRIDRVDVIPLTWDPPKEQDSPDSDYLRELLRRRIAAFNTRGLRTLGELCDPSLRHSIEDEMLEEAHDSPRSLMRLGDLLFAEHCREIPEMRSLLVPTEWERAVERFRATVRPAADTPAVRTVVPAPAPQANLPSHSVPQLRVDLHAGKVYRGLEELPLLSDLEYRLLAFLYHRKGQICSKDEINLAVYEPKYDLTTDQQRGAISDEAIAQLLTRLRRRIELNPSQPVYLTTVKGRGYRLDNTD